jgi:transposase
MLTGTERMELQRRISSRKGRADEARRARCVVLLAEGMNWARIRTQLNCGDSYIARWSVRFAAERLMGLYSRHRAGNRQRSSRPRWKPAFLSRPAEGHKMGRRPPRNAVSLRRVQYAHRGRARAHR